MCLDRVRELRTIVAELHGAEVMSNLDSRSSSECLHDDRIAVLADGRGGSSDRAAIEHVSTCANCRRRLAAVAELCDDKSIRGEIDNLDRSTVLSIPRWTRPRVAIYAGVAVAAVATIVVLGPLGSSGGKGVSMPTSAVQRDVGITTTSAPRLLTEPIVAGGVITLRWTSVPEADLYRVRVWNTDGSVIWSTETRDTIAAMPRDTKRDNYMWEVQARTGWDRWVSSDFTELSIRSSSAQ